MVELIDNGALIDNGGWNNERMKFTEIRYQNVANDTQQSLRMLSLLSPAASGTRLSFCHTALRSQA